MVYLNCNLNIVNTLRIEGVNGDYQTAKSTQ